MNMLVSMFTLLLGVFVQRKLSNTKMKLYLSSECFIHDLLCWPISDTIIPSGNFQLKNAELYILLYGMYLNKVVFKPFLCCSKAITNGHWQADYLASASDHCVNMFDRCSFPPPASLFYLSTYDSPVCLIS